MKYIRKIPSEDGQKTDELVQLGYKRLREPKSVGAAIGFALPLSILLMLLAVFWCYLLDPSLFGFMNEDGISVEMTIDVTFLFYVAGTILCLLIHELFHAVFIPRAWHSKKTYWGFNGAFGFVYTEEEITRGRFLLVSVMPLLLISFVFPVILWFVGIWNYYLIFLSVFNAGGACVDLLNMILVSAQVPFGGTVVSNGYSTFYKSATEKKI
jgi:hypothetical protein